MSPDSLSTTTLADVALEMDRLALGGQNPIAGDPKIYDNGAGVEDDGGVQITCFSEIVNEVNLHFQIIRLPKQIYAWIGCNSAKFGCLYAAATTRPTNTVSVTSLLGGSSDNTGSGIARRIVIKTGLNVALACNIPKDSPMLEAAAEKKLVQKLISLGYTKQKPLKGIINEIPCRDIIKCFKMDNLIEPPFKFHSVKPSFLAGGI